METVKAPDSHPEIILERMIRENQVSLKRLCYLYLHDEAMAEDAVQETFLKAFRSLGDFRGEAAGGDDGGGHPGGAPAPDDGRAPGHGADRDR